jgi:hypothetical protein
VSIFKLEGIFVLFKETIGEVNVISPNIKGLVSRNYETISKEPTYGFFWWC